MTTLKLSFVLSTCIGAAAAWPAAASADGTPRVPLPPAYVQECGACHVPYAPGLLPAASWQRLMAGLGRHYGSDASLDAATARNLAEWLRGALVEPFADFLRRHGLHAVLILSLIAVYRISDIVMGIMANPFYVDLGFSEAEVAAVDLPLDHRISPRPTVG